MIGIRAAMSADWALPHAPPGGGWDYRPYFARFAVVTVVDTSRRRRHRQACRVYGCEAQTGVEMDAMQDREALLTPGEVAAKFRVDPKTVTRWANAGKLTAVRTLGGHRRYRRTEVDALLDGEATGRSA